MEQEPTYADKTGADSMTRREALDALSTALGMPVITVVAGWKGERRVDLGEDALRVFLHVFDAEMSAWKQKEGSDAGELAVFLVGRGGFPEFAQGVCRALRGRAIRATALIPEQINGALALCALGMERRLMHPYAAIGAYDAPALGGARGAPDADTLREIEVFHKLGSSGELTGAALLTPEALIGIAHQRRQARHARHLLSSLLNQPGEATTGFKSSRDISFRDSVIPGGRSGGVASALGSSVLGAHLALSAAQLNAIGVASQLAKAPEAALVWRVFESYEQEFKVLQPAVPRYTESDFADEVEFAPAMDVTGALIEGTQRRFVYELDTGRPDPESGLLDGAWSW